MIVVTQLPLVDHIKQVEQWQTVCARDCFSFYFLFYFTSFCFLWFETNLKKKKVPLNSLSLFVINLFLNPNILFIQ